MNDETNATGLIEPTDHPVDWVNVAFLSLTPLVGIFGTAWYSWRHGIELWMPALLLVMYFLVGISICAGYHRFFSHRSYDAAWPVQIFYAFFGAMAAQNSILWWSASHRTHHQYADRDWDPYSIKRGFWWAHILWIFYKNPQAAKFENSPDLERNPVVMWQHRWHKVILVVGGFGIPTLVGALFGDWLAGLLWGGFLRIAVVHHSTFFVNSLAHVMGKREFDENATARDNWMVAFLTLGEGYHSFHHRFANDYRNAIHWYQWDPSKWFIRTLNSLGLARTLRQTPAPLIEQARMQAALARYKRHIEHPSAVEIREALEKARAGIQSAVQCWKQYSEEKARGVANAWHNRRRANELLRDARREWKRAVRMLSRLPELA